VGFKSV